MKKNIITLAEAIRRLGDNVVICLEPEDRMKAKMEAGKDQELWVFDPVTNRSCRGDGKFFDARYFERGGWGQIGIWEEPDVEMVGETRVVGHVVVQTMTHQGKRLVRCRKTKGLSREILELLPSSYTKNELCSKEQCRPADISEANPQRISGDMLHFLLEEEFPLEEGMIISEFVQTTDGRSLNALVKTGLLVAAA